MRKSKFLIGFLTIAVLFYTSYGKEKKVKKQEIVVPVEKKINEKEFSKLNFKKKQKKEVQVEVK
ncbi:hypothetical protein [Sulfurihydrogenibium subterraneum]|uniref:hypothetical protein n=1 Tax=Sulfurihydrogenibium subterraneum TaxID=171121 RepID=UPI00048EEE9E|nr:hypothetical protein [Sulfurihydrogenibium subterraneum]